ncbi:DUF1127 domain-containing protein [Bosea sp. CER48]|uniref:DUF1127 domain-containing protein n=1 Tax=Bosea sp. CER48 TaxID=3377035 RepID=UPI003820162B
MDCASHAGPLETPGGSTLLHGLFGLWQRRAATARTQRRLAALDSRALGDLGLRRDAIAPPHPRDTADIWLSRIPGGD